MDVYNYDNVSGQILNIPPYTIPVGGDVVSNGSEILELEEYVGLGLDKYKNGVQVIQVASMNSRGKLSAAGKLIPSGSLTESEVLMVGKNVAYSGLRVAIIGASIEVRANPLWSFDNIDYQRINGLVTVSFKYSVADKYFLLGQRIRLACPTNPSIEGSFSILSCTVDPGVGSTITFSDLRSNITAGGAGAAGYVIDLAAYTVPSGWPAFLNLAMGGALDITVIATGSTNIINDWGDLRVQQIVDQGPFDAVIIGAGLIGNAVKDFGAGPLAVQTSLLTLINKINTSVKPRIIFVETLPLSRDVDATDSTFTSAGILNRWLWRDLPSQVPNTVTIPGGEAMIQNYTPYNSNPSSDVQNAWPEQLAMHSDGVHASYGWSRVRGFAVAEGIINHMSKWISPEMGAMPMTRVRATGIDPDGNRFPNRLAGLWGNIDSTKITITSTGCSGVAPANSSMAFVSGRNTSTAVSSLSTNPCGGTDWSIVINGSGSSVGYTFRVEYIPPELLTALNSTEMQGKFCDLLLPITVSVMDSKIFYVTTELVVIVSGQEYILAAPQTNQGLDQMKGIQRVMDAGYSGILKPPRFYIPEVTYSNAFFRFVVSEITGSVASGKTVLRIGPGMRMEVS